jgi:hypothetical protein
LELTFLVGVATEAKELTVLANRKSQLSERLDKQNGISFEKFQDSGKSDAVYKNLYKNDRSSARPSR